MSTATLSAGPRQVRPRVVLATSPVDRAPCTGQSPMSATSTMRLTRRGRLAIVLLVALMGTVGLIFGRGPVAATSSPTAPVVRYVTVEPGDTLWQIARRAAPAADPRATVERIIEINGLSGGGVQAGRSLAVPAAG